MKSRVALDAAMLVVAVAAAELGSGRAGIPSTPRPWLFAFPLLVLVIAAARGMYRPRTFLRVLDDVRAVLTTTALAAMVLLSVRVVFADDPWVAAQTARIWAFASAYLIAGRAVVAWSELQARRRGETADPTLIIGAGRIGRLVAQRLRDHPELGLRPIGFLDKNPIEAEEVDGVPVLGASWDFERVVAEHDVKHVLIGFSTAPDDVILRLVRRCEERGLRVSYVPRFFEKMSGRISVDHLGALPFVTAEPSNPRSWQFTIKYALDRAIAALLLLIMLPVLVIVATAVLVTMGRPIFFRQARVGRDGVVFGMLKFRTMRGSADSDGEADAGWAAQQLGSAVGATAIAKVDRTTRIGRLLRQTSIDELPQFWNVVVGDMALIGPRPERTHYVARFAPSLYRYSDRHRVKAGITGWAQVNGLRGNTSLADRIEWDNYYIENWSFWLDLKILLLTFLAVFARPAAAGATRGTPASR